MTDSAWLTPAERASYAKEWSDPRPSPGDVADLLDHAELADQIIAELANALRAEHGLDCSIEALQRVDALRNETTT